MSLPASSAPTDPPPPAGERPNASLDGQKRSFLRMASHELRTPLNSIIGFAEILARELYGPLGAPQYKQYAEYIETSGQKLLKLVNQILEIARLEGHAMDLSPRRQSLDHALDDAIDGLWDEINARGTEIVVKDQGRLPAVMADARGLRTVIGNILHNAVVFSPDGGQVTVETLPRGESVELRITDCGPGVPRQDIPRLLRPFEQGENALTRRTEGAGLGLPIAALLSQAMGGRLRLSSPEGGGLVVRITLPAAVAPDDADA